VLRIPFARRYALCVSTDAPGRIERVAHELGSDLVRGLAAEEARARLARSGRNELPPSAPVPAWRRFLRQFRGALVLLLVAASVISGVLWWLERDSRLPNEALAILAVLLFNALMGHVQGARAEAALAGLRALVPARARVVRGGALDVIPAAELVRGDLVRVEEGDVVPADARLVESVGLQVSEALLTGESEPVSKAPVSGDEVAGEAPEERRTERLFGGTTVTRGHGLALVTDTGADTEMGSIARLLAAVPEESTPLQRELDRLGRRLGLAVLAIALVMIVTIVQVEHVRSASALLEVAILGVALAVAAVPEGLPAVVTAVLAIGVQRLARRKAIVRHLAAVETLGSASVIASDKTGTLTRNEMTVRVVVSASGRVTLEGSGYAPEGALRAADGSAPAGALRAELVQALTSGERASNAQVEQRAGAWIALGDPTEAALVVAARKAGLGAEPLAQAYARIGELPFSSERKRMSTLHRAGDEGGGLVLFSKGAPDVLIARCTHEQVGDGTRPLGAERRAELEACVEELAGQALRTLAVARRALPASAAGVGTGAGPLDEGLEQELVLTGLIGMLDPPRTEARAAVARAQRAGIRVLMITGDHPRTAQVIARELGLASDERVRTGAELESLSDAELERVVAESAVYARVTPAHKLRLVQALRARGAIVAMTGDGVNDAPALQAADIGIAMGVSGTEVARGAADLVLGDDNFATIVAAVEEGRGIFDNLRKFLRFLLSSNTGEVLTMFFGVLLAEELGLPVEDGAVVLPLLATQILWVNLVTDGAPAFALGVDPGEPDLMERPPRAAGEGALTGRTWRGILAVGVIMAVGTLYVLDAALPGGFVAGAGSLARAQTMAFTTLVLFQLFNAPCARSDEHSVLRRLFSNPWLWGALGAALVLQGLVLYVPFLQRAFGTVALTPRELGQCGLVASSVLWLREAWKLLLRAWLRRRAVVAGRSPAPT